MSSRRSQDAATWHDIGTPLGSPNLRLLRRGRVRALATALRPDVVIERYHNFGGEGLLAARAVGARTVLEVNAPVVDYPGSPKRTSIACSSPNRCGAGANGSAAPRI